MRRAPTGGSSFSPEPVAARWGGRKCANTPALGRPSVVFVALLSIGAISCQSSFPAYCITNLAFPHQARTLDNRLHVVVQPDSSEAEVLVTVHYRVGSALALKAKKGGNPETAKKKTEPKTEPKAGTISHLAQSNAWTSPDETFYYRTVLPGHLEHALGSRAEVMGDFSGDISPEVLDAEREVVKNERRQRYERTPKNTCYLHAMDRFYPSQHKGNGQGSGAMCPK